MTEWFEVEEAIEIIEEAISAIEDAATAMDYEAKRSLEESNEFRGCLFAGNGHLWKALQALTKALNMLPRYEL